MAVTMTMEFLWAPKLADIQHDDEREAFARFLAGRQWGDDTRYSDPVLRWADDGGAQPVAGQDGG